MIDENDPWYYRQALARQQEIQQQANRYQYQQWFESPLPSLKKRKHDAEPQPEPTRTGMNYSTAVFLINNNVRAVKGTYQDGEGAVIFKTLDASIKKDDLVVVPTHTRHKFTVFKITEVDVDVDMDSQTKMEWIISKVDEAPYDKLLAEEADAISKIKSAELRKKRNDLADNLLKDSIESIRALPIASAGGEPTAES